MNGPRRGERNLLALFKTPKDILDFLAWWREEGERLFAAWRLFNVGRDVVDDR